MANGTIVLKFYLNVSKKEQKKRFLERIDKDDKNWKFSVNDARERSHWKEYMRAYEDVFTHTSSKAAPWYIIPADNKWFMRLAVAAITVQTLEDLNLKYPTLTKAKKEELLQARKVLMADKGYRFFSNGRGVLDRLKPPCVRSAGVSFSCRRTDCVSSGLLVVLVSRPSSAQAQAGTANGGGTASAKPQLRSQRISQPPAIDGVLDDVAWRDRRSRQATGSRTTRCTARRSRRRRRSGSVTTRTISISRSSATTPPVEHQDLDHPARQHLGRRLGRHQPRRARTGQLSYHLMVNPSGVQLDMLNSASGGEDQSPDYVWDSAGRRNDQGYAVEMRVPLQTIRFKGGADVRMGILFWRRVSRAGVSVAWPPLEPGKWVFDKHASLSFGELGRG